MTKIGIISGSFDLLHFGHIEYLNEASKRFDQVVPIINTSDWVYRWKKREAYLPTHSVLKGLHKAYPNFITSNNFFHTSLNKSVADTLAQAVYALRENGYSDITFFKMKDRDRYNTPEIGLCDRLGIKFEHLQGNVEQHTSELYNDFSERVFTDEYQKWKDDKEQGSSSL